MATDFSIERRLVLGLIVSDTFISEVRKIWEPHAIQSAMAKRLAGWCIAFYDKYQKAPGPDIEGIFMQKLQEGLPQDIAEEIEEDILPELSEQFAREKLNTAFLLDEAKEFFSRRHLELHAAAITAHLSSGDLANAEKVAAEFKAIAPAASDSISLNSQEAQDRVELAFAESNSPLIRYPGALGTFLNPSLVRGGFIAFLAPEKRGKTFMLMDISTRAVRQGANVAFFQAGDMTENQQLRRICVHLARRSDKQRYCGDITYPCLDCERNQTDACSRKGRACNFGALASVELSELGVVRSIQREALQEAMKRHPDYEPCYIEGCPDLQPSIWLKSTYIPEPLTAKDAKEALSSFFTVRAKVLKSKRGDLRLSTHANGTLTVRMIEGILDTWYREDGFLADVILVDYADLLEADERTLENRHKENAVWKALRRVSQERHALVVTATQADSSSYSQDSLKLKNFSEDKRKYAHVTAMFGLNQDAKGREKKLGLMRLNELVIREDEGDQTRQVYILQCLQRGQPHIGSFFLRPHASQQDVV
jgi:hypothetical protein